MTDPPRVPLLDYIPGYPERRSVRRAMIRWWKETWGWLKHTVAPTEMGLPPPARRVEPPEDATPPADVKERLAAAKGLVDSAEKRLDTVRSKATSLLGFVALLTPILSWWLATGRERIGAAPVPLAVVTYGLMLVAGLSLTLCLRALFRSQAVASYTSLTPALYLDLEKGEFRPHDWAGELVTQLEVWGEVQRWSDVVVDYFRAGQRFLGISLVAAVLAGVISYLYPQPGGALNLVARPTGELAVQGPPGRNDAATQADRWEAALWYGLVLVMVSTGVFFVARSRYKKGPAPTAVPECRNIVQVTAAAAAKVRGFQSGGTPYLRVTARQIGTAPASVSFDLVTAADPSSHFLGESEGVQIVVPRECAGLLTRPLVDWVVGEDGKEGLQISTRPAPAAVQPGSGG